MQKYDTLKATTLQQKIVDGPFYFQSELVRVFCVDFLVQTSIKRSMICDYITAIFMVECDPL